MSDAASSLPPTPEDDVEMAFFDHIRELRKRIGLALLGPIPGTVLAWTYKERLLELLLSPYVAAWRRLDLGEPAVHIARAQELFVEYMWMAIIAGIFVGAPWIFYQLWAFIAPGLYRREKMLALPFVVSATAFFVGGAYFCYAFVLEYAMQMFLAMTGALPGGDVRVQPTIMVAEYLDFVTKFLLAFGVVFEVPVVTTLLCAIGMVDYKDLLRFARWWLVIASIVAAVLTPPDPVTQLIMMVPLVVLYFLSIGVAYLMHFFKQKKEPAPESEPE